MQGKRPERAKQTRATHKEINNQATQINKHTNNQTKQTDQQSNEMMFVLTGVIRCGFTPFTVCCSGTVVYVLLLCCVWNWNL
jgi:hypothetical protein